MDQTCELCTLHQGSYVSTPVGVLFGLFWFVKTTDQITTTLKGGMCYELGDNMWHVDMELD